ncbi:MAG: CDP-diacylglycerol--serine O-phosphatidyltransferase, partial [Nitrospirota bacterium]
WGAAFLFAMCGALRVARYNVQIGSAESKAFTGMPIPAAATVIASLILFYNEMWGVLPGKNYMILMMPFLLAILMVSTLRYHGIKEIDPKSRRPFWILVVFVIVLVLVFVHPQIVIFVFSIAYMLWGIIENAALFYRKRKLKGAVQ